jgi:cyclase
MLRTRVIPIVLLNSNYSVVKTIQFNIRRNLGNPIVVSRIYDTRGVDELILLDIDASKEERDIDMHTVETVSSECFMPLTIGGGLRTCDDIERALKVGADKVSLNSVIFERPEFLKEAVSVFGSQCIVASIDVKKDENGTYMIFSHSNRKVKYRFEEFLQLVIGYGVGEILLNSVDRDGTMTGYDLELISYASSMVSIPLIVAGGISGPEDCVKAIKSGASAVAATSIFHFTQFTPEICKQSLAKAGIPVRRVQK